MAMAMAGGWPESGAPDPRIQERMDDITAKVDCSAISVESLEKIAFIELAIEELVKLNQLDCIAFDCWSYLSAEFGIQACFILGDLIDRGLVAACETDIHAAITARLLQAAARGQSAPFVADLTIRHPTNDNAELLWHCGPFAYSLRKAGGPTKAVNMRQWFPVKDGTYTIARLDQEKGAYRLLDGVFESTDGPHTFGTYLWAKFKDRAAWERKLIDGPYIHHFAEIEGDWRGAFEEFSRYVPELSLDRVEE